jgi:hypothetical protein
MTKAFNIILVLELCLLTRLNMGSTPGKGPEMVAAWVSQSSPEHPPQVAMNFQSEETFFNFDMFNEDNSEDLNFLFSETPEIPEIPAPSNDATDPGLPPAKFPQTTSTLT